MNTVGPPVLLMGPAGGQSSVPAAVPQAQPGARLVPSAAVPLARMPAPGVMEETASGSGREPCSSQGLLDRRFREESDHDEDVKDMVD